MEIHGLLRISKTKPRIVQNTTVAQICGSMERKEVLHGVAKFEEAKWRKSSCQSSKRKQKKKSKEDFLQMQSNMWVAKVKHWFLENEDLK